MHVTPLDRTAPETSPVTSPLPRPTATSSLLAAAAGDFSPADDPATAELFELLVARARRLGIDAAGFKARPWAEARSDFARIVRGLSDLDPALVVDILHAQVAEIHSFNRFAEALTDYWETYRLEDQLHRGAIAVVTNHRFFTDLFLAPAALAIARAGFDPAVRDRNTIVMSPLMATRTVDVGFGPVPVTPIVGALSRQLHTVQKLPPEASPAVQQLRRNWNDCTKRVWATLAAEPGNVVHLAGGGGPDEVARTEAGRQLVMRPVNREAARLLSNGSHDRADGEPVRDIVTVGMFVSCPFTGPVGQPGAVEFAFVPPRRLSCASELDEVLVLIADAGSDLLAGEFPGGVHYAASRDEFDTLTATPAVVSAASGQ